MGFTQIEFLQVLKLGDELADKNSVPLTVLYESGTLNAGRVNR